MTLNQGNLSNLIYKIKLSIRKNELIGLMNLLVKKQLLLSVQKQIRPTLTLTTLTLTTVMITSISNLSIQTLKSPKTLKTTLMMTMTQLIKLLIKQTQLKIPMKNQSTTLQITTVDMKKMKYHN